MQLTPFYPLQEARIRQTGLHDELGFWRKTVQRELHRESLSSEEMHYRQETSLFPRDCALCLGSCGTAWSLTHPRWPPAATSQVHLWTVGIVWGTIVFSASFTLSSFTPNESIPPVYIHLWPLYCNLHWELYHVYCISWCSLGPFITWLFAF